MNRLLAGILAIVLAVCFNRASDAEILKVYSLGNSLTVSMSALVMDDAHLTANEPNPLRVGFHALCGESLQSIVANPGVNCLGSPWYGQYPAAFQNNQFTAVTLQPWPGSNNSTIRQEVAAATTIANSIGNPNTRIIVYATWGDRSNFVNSWQATGYTLDSVFTPSKQTYDIFMDELRKSFPNAQLLPAGHTFFELASKIDQGLLPGLTSIGDLYSDSIHVSAAGRYALSMAAYSTIYGKSPEGLGLPPIYNAATSGPQMNDPEARRVTQEVAWSAVQSFSSVPEPNSLALIGAAMLWVARRSFCSRKNRVE